MLMLMPGGAVKMYMHRVEIFGFFSDAGDNDTVSSANEVIRFGSCWPAWYSWYSMEREHLAIHPFVICNDIASDSSSCHFL